jgi:hypothetical protein
MVFVKVPLRYMILSKLGRSHSKLNSSYRGPMVEDDVDADIWSD